MSGLASIQAQLGKHRNAYLAAAAGGVVLLALHNRQKSTAAAAAVPAAITSGNPQFSAGAAQLDTSSLTSQLWDIQSSLNGLAASTTPNGTVPSPATQAGGGLAGGLPITAPLGGGSSIGTPAPAPAVVRPTQPASYWQSSLDDPYLSPAYKAQAAAMLATGDPAKASAALNQANGLSAADTAGYVTDKYGNVWTGGGPISDVGYYLGG